MYYTILGSNIMFENKDFRLFQPMNPLTGLPFESKKDQVKWIEDSIKGYYNTTKAVINFCDVEDNSIKSLYSNTPFKLQVSIDMKIDTTISAKIFSDSGYEKEIEINFVGGVADIDLEFSISDKYYVQLDGSIVLEDSTIYLIHEQHEYMMYIGN